MKTLKHCLNAVLAAFFLFQCTGKTAEKGTEEVHETHQEVAMEFNGFESQIALGEHLVLIGGCNDCHTPKKIGTHGIELDSALWLSGHPAGSPSIDVDRKAMESKGLVVTQVFTEWVGPWGVSYAANLTPDASGLGSWTDDQFIYAIRNGKYKGLPNSRPLLPPMPWEMFKFMTDMELKAIFAYLQSIKPVSNMVPPPIPPVGVQ
jgi:hypothetical protein